jgi:hypothetical protein
VDPALTNPIQGSILKSWEAIYLFHQLPDLIVQKLHPGFLNMHLPQPEVQQRNERMEEFLAML